MSLQVKDDLGLGQHPDVRQVLHEDENIIWSGEMIKINKRNNHQVRRICLTNYKLINTGDEASFMESIVTFFTGTNIKRMIYFPKIKYITYSEHSNEFVVHVPTEHDYRFRSSSLRDEFLFYLIQLVFLFTDKLPKIWFVEDLELKRFTRYEDSTDATNPPFPPIEMSAEEFRVYFTNKNLKLHEELRLTETILSRDGRNLKEDDFEILRLLGKGGFGKVVLAEKKDTGQYYAVKIIDKVLLLEKNNVSNILSEKEVLQMCDHPFLIGLDYCFHSPSKVYLVMEFMQGGELYHHLHKDGRFSEKDAAFYGAQILLALDYLHGKGVLYRDLKPENVLVGLDGYIKIADFGVSKKLAKGTITHTIVGTPEYIPPEIINEKGHNEMADWWSFGVLMYELLTGTPPFVNRNKITLLQSIMNDEVIFPEHVKLSSSGKDLIRKLLKKDPADRLGSRGVDDIKQHAFFASTKWSKILEKKESPPLSLEVRGPLDIRYFEKGFVSTFKHLSSIKDDDLDTDETNGFEGFDMDFE